MRRFVALLVVCAIAVPAMAELTQTIDLGVLQTNMIGSTLPQTLGPTVYENSDTNGYYTGFTADDVYKGELCVTTMTGAWTMDGFAIGVYVPAAGTHTIPVEFYQDDGSYPYAGQLRRWLQRDLLDHRRWWYHGLGRCEPGHAHRCNVAGVRQPWRQLRCADC